MSTFIRNTTRILITTTLLLEAAGAAAEGLFTLEQVMSSPFPTNLAASPSGGSFAWVFNARGARNVWVAERDAAGHYRARPLTRHAEDDGQGSRHTNNTRLGRGRVDGGRP